MLLAAFVIVVAFSLPAKDVCQNCEHIIMLPPVPPQEPRGIQPGYEQVCLFCQTVCKVDPPLDLTLLNMQEMGECHTLTAR